MIIRKAEWSDLPEMLKSYARARQFMKETGNPNQWKDTNPSEAVVEQGIRDQKAYVCVAEGPEDGKEGEELKAGDLLGTFYFAIEEDPTYHKIYKGSWLNEKPYGVVHRVAASGRGKGFSGACFDWAGRQCGNLKIDTHEDNHVMQHVLEKNGFKRCGIIYLENGEERVAYQRVRE
ncbi:MAG: GNAT family protein [Lachnospiraceae bacterium]|nr:GNAT family protein [Lachnospiraceae bacterium]